MDVLYGLATLLLAVVLLAAGIGKLVRPPTPAHMTALGLPPRAASRGAIRGHAVVEIALAAGLIGAPGPALAAVSALALALTIAYLVVAWRAWRAPEPLACHCFGWDDDRVVSPWHLVLNVGLVAAAGVVVAAGLSGWWAITGVHPGAIGAVGVLAIVGEVLAAGARDSTRRGTYLRRPIPDVEVTVGSVRRRLPELASHRAVLLVRIPPRGKEREYLDAALPGWRSRLPHLDVHAVTGMPVRAVRRLGTTAPASAVVLGADGLLAAGPVQGYDEISSLVGELAAVRPTS